MSFSVRHRGRRLSAVAAVLLLIACGNKDPHNKPVVKPTAPAPAPAALVAEARVNEPRRVLTEIRDAAGGPALMLPRTVGGLVANLLDYPLRTAEMFDEQLPVVAATTATKAGETNWAVAVHTRKRDELLLLLSGGGTPAFRKQAAGDAQCLMSNDTSKQQALVGCVLDHYLVIANSPAAAESIGPYAVRTLATQPRAGKGDLLAKLTPAAFDHWLPTHLASLHTRLNPANWSAGARSLVDIDMLLSRITAWSKEAGSGDFAVQLGGEAWTVEGNITPKDDAIAARWAGWPKAEVGTIAQLPDDTLVAANWTEDETSRADEAKRQAAALTTDAVFDDEDRAALGKALAALASGRGDRTVLGLRCTGVGVTGFARSDARDAAKLDDALTQLGAFSQRDAVTKQLNDKALVLERKKTRMVKLPQRCRVVAAAAKASEGQTGTPGGRFERHRPSLHHHRHPSVGGGRLRNGRHHEVAVRPQRRTSTGEQAGHRQGVRALAKASLDARLRRPTGNARMSGGHARRQAGDPHRCEPGTRTAGRTAAQPLCA